MVQKLQLSEDWSAVAAGGLLLLLALTGVPLPAPAFHWQDAGELSGQVFTAANAAAVAVIFALMYALSVIATGLSGKSLRPQLQGFPMVFGLTLLAMLLAGNSFFKSWNLEAVIFSLFIGLVIRNIWGLPVWLRDSLATELMVKIGLVLLGASIIFGDILKAGFLGLIQALVVVVVVWYFAFWLSRRLGIDKEMAIMISSAVSICGVSAAIATAGAIEGDRRKLSYVISLVLITAIPMIIFMPMAAGWLGLSQAVAGAWMGGTIDTSGGVIASGSLIGEEAMKISTIVKFSQNVLLGLAAFFISVYWSYAGSAGLPAEKPSLRILWDRFPKFVLGFVGASLLFSFALEASLVDEVKGGLKNMQGFFFAFAFTCIGLETDFRELFQGQGRAPLYAFLLAQLFNVLVTLILAALLFGYWG
jgi:uncharacterized integral membrane protein (TIGR00698 family)